MTIEKFKEYYIGALDSLLVKDSFKGSLKNELIVLGSMLGLDKEKLYNELSVIELKMLANRI